MQIYHVTTRFVSMGTRIVMHFQLLFLGDLSFRKIIAFFFRLLWNTVRSLWSKSFSIDPCYLSFMSHTEEGTNLILDDLPDDVLFAILAFCNVKTLLILSCVNRNLHRVASHDVVWRRISKRCINLRKSDKKYVL